MSPNDLGQSRFAVAAGRSVGNAVQRNRTKRMIRAALQLRFEAVQPGWDCILLARKPMVSANFQDTQLALQSLFNRAKLVKQYDVG
jgi:ribonuclease P protein component